MHRAFKVVTIGLLLAFLFTGCSYLRPEPEVKVEKVKIAVVNKDLIWGESEFGAKYQQKLEDKAAELRKKTEADSLQQDAELMRELDSYRQKLRNEFSQKVESVVQEIMEQEGYHAVLDQSKVKYGGIDVTNQVIEKLNNEK